MNPRIMVVDDDSVQHLLVGGAIRQCLPDAEITFMTDAHSALQQLVTLIATGSRLPDLIVTDLNMSGMNGWELLGSLKQHDRLRTIPVVMATTEASHDPKSAFQQSPGVGDLTSFFRKPITLAAVRVALQAALPYGFPPARFLVMHDEERLLRGALTNIRAWLGVLQYAHPLTTNSVHGALTLLESLAEPIDGVIVGMDDWDKCVAFVQTVRATLQTIRPTRSCTPIMVFTDVEDVVLHEDLRVAGATGFLSLPLNQGNLASGLRPVFGAPPRDWPHPPGRPWERPRNLEQLVGRTDASD